MFASIVRFASVCVCMNACVIGRVCMCTVHLFIYLCHVLLIQIYSISLMVCLYTCVYETPINWWAYMVFSA